MAWLLLLVVFWKPTYYLIRAGYSQFISKDGLWHVWLGKTTDWFKLLFNIVKPGDL